MGDESDISGTGDGKPDSAAEDAANAPASSGASGGNRRRLILIAGGAVLVVALALAGLHVSRTVSCNNYELDSERWKSLRLKTIIEVPEKEWMVDNAEKIARCDVVVGLRFSEVRDLLGRASGAGLTRDGDEVRRNWQWYLGFVRGDDFTHRDALFVDFDEASATDAYVGVAIK